MLGVKYINFLQLLFAATQPLTFVFFLEMVMFISLVGTVTQIRKGTGCITFSAMGPRRGQHAFLM